MKWSWELIVALNKLICEASGQPHAVREIPWWADSSEEDFRVNLPHRCKTMANEHYFVEGNKRTAACVAVCLALEGV